MRKPFLKVALIPAVLLLVFASGCNLVDSPDTDAALGNGPPIVIQEEFCVTFSEYRTSGTFQSEIVAEEFAAQISAWLDANGVLDLNIIKIRQIFQSGGRIVLPQGYTGHPWDITSAVTIQREDIPDEPQEWLRAQTVTLPDDLLDPGYVPRFRFRGVKTINRALEDLAAGGDPMLRVTMVTTDVDPEPSPSDPLVFTWDACVNVICVYFEDKY
jgi:hypothetical protein